MSPAPSGLPPGDSSATLLPPLGLQDRVFPNTPSGHRVPLPIKALWQKCQAPEDLLAAGELLDVGTGDGPGRSQVLHAQTIAHWRKG